MVDKYIDRITDDRAVRIALFEIQETVRADDKNVTKSWVRVSILNVLARIINLIPTETEYIKMVAVHHIGHHAKKESTSNMKMTSKELSLIIGENVSDVIVSNEMNSFGSFDVSFIAEERKGNRIVLPADTIARLMKEFIMSNSIDFDMKYRQGVCIAEIQIDGKTYHSGSWLTEFDTLILASQWVLERRRGGES